MKIWVTYTLGVCVGRRGFECAPLGGVLGPCWLICSQFWRIFWLSWFILVFLMNFWRFGLDLSRFGEGFGRIWGGQNGPQIDIFGIFLDMFVEIFFLSNFDRFFPKSIAKDIEIFNACSTRRFINGFLNLLISSMLET